MYNPHKVSGIHRKGLTDYHTFCSSRCRHMSLANTIDNIPLRLGSTNGQVYILTVLLSLQPASLDKPPLIQHTEKTLIVSIRCLLIYSYTLE